MKMKRTLSLVLALVMVLGTFGTVFAETVVETPETNVAAGALLKELGVLVGNAEGDLMLEQGLKRQDTAVLVAKLMGEFDAAKEFPTVKGEIPTYEDIEDHFYLPFLAWAQANKTFVGHTPARFGFDEEMTVQQFAKVLLTVLGYEVGPEADVKYEDVVQKVFDLKIIDTTDEMGFTRGVMAMMTYNALNTKMKDSDKTLAEFLDIEMPEVEEPKAEELKIEEIYTENLAEVVVELSNSDLVTTNDELLNPDNYRLSNGVKVEHVHLDGDDVILTLVPYGKVGTETPKVLVKGENFRLTVRNVDPKINTTSGWITAVDNTIPEVVSVDFMGDYGIKVTTNEPIANPAERNFRLDSRTAMIVEQYGRDIILTPYHGKAFDKDAVELIVDKLVDFAGYTSVRTVEDIELSDDTGLPKVIDTYRSGDKLVVEFDRDVYHDSISEYVNRRILGNASFTERRVEFYAKDAEKVDTNVVEYTFSRDIPKGVEVTVQGVANHFNKAMEKDVRVPGEYRDEYAPVIISSTTDVQVIDEDNVVVNDLSKEDRDKGKLVATKNMTITFDKDIAEFKNLKQEDLKDFFTLYELDITRRGENAADDVKINLVKADKDTIVLSFEDIKYNNADRDFDYILEVRNFSDDNRNRMDRDYLDFQVVKQGTAFEVKIDGIEPTSYFNRRGVELVLDFNKPVNREEAADARNYSLDGKLVIDEAIVERNGRTVSLVIYDIKDEAELLAKYDVLDISPRIKSISNQALANMSFTINDRKPVVNQDVLDAKAVKAAEKMFLALPKAEDVKMSNEEAIQDAKLAWDELGGTLQAEVSETAKDHFMAALSQLRKINLMKLDKVGVTVDNEAEKIYGEVQFVDFKISEVENIELTLYNGTKKLATLTAKDKVWEDYQDNTVIGGTFKEDDYWTLVKEEDINVMDANIIKATVTLKYDRVLELEKLFI